MRLAKRTYSLPPDLLARFERRLASGDRSRFLARLIEAWLAEQEREELRKQVVEGCTAMADVYQDIDKEWNTAADEVWRDSE